MPSPFAITAASNTVLLAKGRQGETSFTVTNVSGRPLRGRARLVAENPEAGDWLTLVGQPERLLAIAATEQVAVRIAVPPNAAPGGYPFRLDVVGVENPDEEFSRGPTVTFQVPEPEAPRKPFPWWIVAAVVAVIVIAGAVYLLLQSQAAARARAASATATAIAQADATATADAQAAATATSNAATATAVAQADATATAVAAANATATAQAVSATATAVAARQYDGVWLTNSDTTHPLSQIDIASDGTNVNVTAHTQVRDIMAGGGWASQVCNPACSWGPFTVPFNPSALRVNFNAGSGITYELLITITTDGATLSVTHRAIGNGSQLLYSMNRTYHRRRLIVDDFRVLVTPLPLFERDRFRVSP